MTFIEVNNTNLYYEIIGSGEAVVLVHSGLCDSRMWEQQVNALAPHYQVLRYDLRGMGQSPAPDGTFTHHEDLMALLDHLKISSAVLVGSSFGGTIALDFALAYPEMAKALVLIGSMPAGTTPPDSLIEKWAEIDEVVESGDIAKAVEMELQLWVDGVGRTPDQVNTTMREFVREMNMNNFAVANPQAEMDFLQPRAATHLHEIKIPILLVTGEYDLPDRVAFVQNAVFANVQRHIINNAAHLPSLEHPEQFNALLLAFLQNQ